MADDADVAGARQEQIDDLAWKAAAKRAQAIEQGHEGICDSCGDECPRLMSAQYFMKRNRHDVAELVTEGNGICPRCRDKHKFP